MDSTKLLCVGILALILSLSVFLTISTDQVYAAKYPYKATLSGQSEVPPVETSATGEAEFTVPTNGLMKYRVNITGLSNSSAAHIHAGSEGENGDVVADLLNTPMSQDKDTAYGMIFRGNLTDASLKGPMEGKTLDDLAAAMDSGETYVNVHTPDFADGEIRGQIINTDSQSTSNTRDQANWLNICKSVEWGLMNTCDVYVNPDGSLTVQGERAKGCVTNGGLLSGAGILSGLPASTIIGILEPLSERTGCGGIVNWATLKSATNPMDFLNQLR